MRNTAGMVQPLTRTRSAGPGVRTLFRWWFPTVFGASMLVVEIPLVAAAAARSADAGRALAAIGVGMSILVVVNTPALAITALVAAERGRGDGRRLRRYTATVGVLGSLVVLALAVPPGSVAVRALFDLDADTAGAVSAFLTGLAPNSLGVAVRRYQHGRLIHDRRTGPIVWATLARLAATGALAWTATAALPAHGPIIAGAALSAGAFLEAAALALSRSAAPASAGPAHPASAGPAHPASAGPAHQTWTGLIVHHGHLSAGRLLVMAPTVITIVGVAHATRAAESLVVWPVLIQLTALFTSPTTDWESVAATALREHPGNRAPRRLTAWLAAAVSALFTVTVLAGPADLFIRRLLAVPNAPADLGLAWTWLLLPVPALWIIRAYLRGTVMAAGAPGWLSMASLCHTATLVGALLVLTHTDMPGVACAATALTTGILTETTVTLLAARLTHTGPRRRLTRN
jgi:hypothetical protein